MTGAGANTRVFQNPPCRGDGRRGPTRLEASWSKHAQKVARATQLFVGDDESDDESDGELEYTVNMYVDGSAKPATDHGGTASVGWGGVALLSNTVQGTADAVTAIYTRSGPAASEKDAEALNVRDTQTVIMGQNMSETLGGTSSTAEATALLGAVNAVDHERNPNVAVQIYTDSKSTLDALSYYTRRRSSRQQWNEAHRAVLHNLTAGLADDAGWERRRRTHAHFVRGHQDLASAAEPHAALNALADLTAKEVAGKERLGTHRPVVLTRRDAGRFVPVLVHKHNNTVEHVRGSVRELLKQEFMERNWQKLEEDKSKGALTRHCSRATARHLCDAMRKELSDMARPTAAAGKVLTGAVLTNTLPTMVNVVTRGAGGATPHAEDEDSQTYGSVARWCARRWWRASWAARAAGGPSGSVAPRWRTRPGSARC